MTLEDWLVFQTAFALVYGRPLGVLLGIGTGYFIFLSLAQIFARAIKTRFQDEN